MPQQGTTGLLCPQFQMTIFTVLCGQITSQFFVDTLFGYSTYTTASRGLSDGKRVQITCPEAVRAYNENMGVVDLSDQMRKFYTCTHRSSQNWYLRLLWFLEDTAINNASILESFRQDRTAGQCRCRNKIFVRSCCSWLLSF